MADFRCAVRPLDRHRQRSLLRHPSRTRHPPKTSYGKVKSNYFSFGYFLDEFCPTKCSTSARSPTTGHPTLLRPVDPKIDHIIFIVGESESAAHVGAFGYERNTTPFFSEIKGARRLHCPPHPFRSLHDGCCSSDAFQRHSTTQRHGADHARNNEPIQARQGSRISNLLVHSSSSK